MTTKLPPIKWAQRKDSLYVTIELPDITDEKLVLTSDKLQFSGNSLGNHYEIELKFFKEVDTTAKQSKWKIHSRNVQFFILKKEKNEPFWPRLLEDKHLEKTNVTIDWNKFVDEDERDEKFDESLLGGGSGFDFSHMMKDLEKNPPPPPTEMTNEDMEYIEKHNPCPMGFGSKKNNSKKKTKADEVDDDELLKDLEIAKTEEAAKCPHLAGKLNDKAADPAQCPHLAAKAKEQGLNPKDCPHLAQKAKDEGLHPECCPHLAEQAKERGLNISDCPALKENSMKEHGLDPSLCPHLSTKDHREGVTPADCPHLAAKAKELGVNPGECPYLVKGGAPPNPASPTKAAQS